MSEARRLRNQPRLPGWIRSASAWIDLQSGLRQQRVYLHELESLRGVAILLVILFHCWGVSGLQFTAETPMPLAFIAAGNTGVTLFFVLSGFLLSLPWLRALREDSPAPSVKRFLWARVLRILPLYYAALLFTLAVMGKPEVIFRAAAFQFVGYELFPYSVVWWTLGTEVQFYLLLPLAMLLLHAGRIGWLILGALLTAWLASYCLWLLPGPAAGEKFSHSFTHSLFGRLPAFFLGCAAAWAYLLAGQRRLPGYAGTLLCAGCLLALALVLNATMEMGPKRAEQHWHLHHSYESLAWAGVILALLLSNFPGKWTLVNLPLAILGKLSYSLYLIHVPVLFYLIYPARTAIGDAAYHDSASLYLVCLAGIAISIALSALTYRTIEKPFLNLKRRF